MDRYEFLYIIPSKFTDDEVGKVEVQVSEVLAKHGAAIESTKRLGKMRLAYPIKCEQFGHYVLVMMMVEHSALAKLDAELKITPVVLRHLIVKSEQKLEDQTFALVEFREVDVEGRADRRRKEKIDAAKRVRAKKEEIQHGVAALEETKDVSPDLETAPIALEPGITKEELDKTIESALSEDIKGL